MNAADQALFDKIKQLPPQRLAEVEDFVDFLREREAEQRLTQAAADVKSLRRPSATASAKGALRPAAAAIRLPVPAPPPLRILRAADVGNNPVHVPEDRPVVGGGLRVRWLPVVLCGKTRRA